jgi:hypothetical protein
MVEQSLHSPMSSWHSASLIKHRGNFTLPLLGIEMRFTIKLKEEKSSSPVIIEFKKCNHAVCFQNTKGYQVWYYNSNTLYILLLSEWACCGVWIMSHLQKGMHIVCLEEQLYISNCFGVKYLVRQRGHVFFL